MISYQHLKTRSKEQRLVIKNISLDNLSRGKSRFKYLQRKPNFSWLLCFLNYFELRSKFPLLLQANWESRELRQIWIYLARTPEQLYPCCFKVLGLDYHIRTATYKRRNSYKVTNGTEGDPRALRLKGFWWNLCQNRVPESKKVLNHAWVRTFQSCPTRIWT